MTRTTLAAILLSLTGLTSAYADPYLYGALGQANGDLVDKPGLWRHEGTPYTTDLQDLAWKAGLGMRFETGVFIEAGVIDPGSMNIESKFVKDAHYDPVAMRCKKDCHKQSALGLQNDMIGGELVMGYQYNLLDFFGLYAKGGVAGFAHEHSGTFNKYGPTKVREFDSEQNTMGQNFSGMVLAVAFGGGVCAPAAKVELCGDVTRYHYVATTANPLTEGLTIGTAYLKVPLKGWW